MDMTTMLLEKMKQIVDQHVKHFKTDFEVDVDTIRRIAEDPKQRNRPMFWIVRECGTHMGYSDMLGEDSYSRSVYDFYLDSPNAIYYAFCIGTGELKPIWNRQRYRKEQAAAV